MANKTILMGRLGKDPEIKQTKTNDNYATFTMATSETWKDKTTGERKSQTEWHNIIVWRGLTKVIEHFKKGDMIYVEGKNTTISWDDNGEKRFMHQIVASCIEFTGKKNESKENNNQSINQNNSFDEDTDDLPF